MPDLPLAGPSRELQSHPSGKFLKKVIAVAIVFAVLTCTRPLLDMRGLPGYEFPLGDFLPPRRRRLPRTRP